MSLRYQFAISSQAPIIWKDSLFITSVWRFFAANGKSVFLIIAASFALCTIVATDEVLHSCRIHNIRIDTTVNSYEGTTRHRLLFKDSLLISKKIGLHQAISDENDLDSRKA